VEEAAAATAQFFLLLFITFYEFLSLKNMIWAKKNQIFWRETKTFNLFHIHIIVKNCHSKFCQKIENDEDIPDGAWVDLFGF
jgi:hypothetical protein